MDRLFASSSTAAEAARQSSSIDDVQRWLTTLTEATSTQQLESVRAAAKVLQVCGAAAKVLRIVDLA